MACIASSPVAQQTSKQRVDISTWHHTSTSRRRAHITELWRAILSQLTVDITRMELDIETSSLVADEATADIEEEEFGKARRDRYKWLKLTFTSQNSSTPKISQKHSMSHPKPPKHWRSIRKEVLSFFSSSQTLKTSLQNSFLFCCLLKPEIRLARLTSLFF